MERLSRPGPGRRAIGSGVLGALVGAVVLAGCGADEGATVEVDLFSGRENPTFHLDSEAEATFGRTVAALAPSVSVPLSTAQDRNFRGFVVSTVGNNDVGDGQVYRVLPGVVIREGTIEGLADPGNLAYALLLQSAEGELSDQDRGALEELTAEGG